MQLSTMPSWMYINGTDPSYLKTTDPWQFRSGRFSEYMHGSTLRDPSCREMARCGLASSTTL